MSNETTGSLVKGTIKGLRAGTSFPSNTITYGNPSGLIVCVQESGLAIDVTNGSIYMALTPGDKNWIALGSAAF